MLEYGDTQAQQETEPPMAAEQLLSLLLDAALEPEERRSFLASAVRFLGVSRAGVQSYVETRYGVDEWRRTELYLDAQPWGAAGMAVGGFREMAENNEQDEEAN